MEIIARRGRENLAWLYIARTEDGSLLEYVESIQPPIPREKKWVLIVSTLKGCPVSCLFCDAGGSYRGPLSVAEILAQIDSMILPRFPDRRIPIPKFKVQFARMGEPSLNDAVLEVLRQLPRNYDTPGLMPCISTVLPQRRERFFEDLRVLKNDLFPQGRFQLQFSLHTTDFRKRRQLIPYPVLSFTAAARLGKNFFNPGDRKIGLNFAAARGYPIDADVLLRFFDPSIFVVKITPLNPTENGRLHSLETQIGPRKGDGSAEITRAIRGAGYDVILSLGEPEEDFIGSNCGQYIHRYEAQQELLWA